MKTLGWLPTHTHARKLCKSFPKAQKVPGKTRIEAERKYTHACHILAVENYVWTKKQLNKLIICALPST